MQTKKKLWITGMSLAIALVVLVTATLAWFTVSTSPEISGMQVSLYTDRTLLLSADNEDYSQLIDLSAKFADLTPIKPVSTVDGVNWFIPTYNADGSLQAPEEFILDDEYEYANVSTVDPVTKQHLTGAALMEAWKKGYYVYADFWMKTEEDGGCRVRLSVPHLDSSELDESERTNGAYGTYVLENYRTESDGVKLYDNRAESAMRVGFLIDPVETASPSENKGKKFFIYEPNADKRSSSAKPIASESTAEAKKAAAYVLGYEYKGESYYKNDYYYVTQPIGATESQTGLHEGEMVGYIAEASPSQLIVQKKSAWDMSKLQAKVSEGKEPDSNDVANFGRFMEVNSQFTHIDLEDETTREFNLTDIYGDIAGNNIIVTLKKDTPVKIRLFIWIEGQDVDCWNDIASGSFVVNLELAGESTK